MKKNNIGVLIVIILLLLICIPSAIYGTYMHYKIEALGGNPDKNFYHEGKLFFYNNDKLLGTYTCIEKDCGYATNYVDNNYDFEAYNTRKDEIKLINNHYAFIKDGEKIVLYDVLKENKLVEYKAVKNYGVGIANDYFIVKSSNDLWGMIKISNNVNVAIPNIYQHLGLLNKTDEKGELDSSKLISLNAQDWQIISNENKVLATVNNPIIDYNNKYIITKNDIGIKLYDYNNTEILNTYPLANVEFIEYLIVAKTTNGFYVIYNTNTNSVIKTMANNNLGEYVFKIENNTLVITQNNQVLETIALN